MKPAVAAEEIAAAAADARAQEAHMRASYSTKYGYPFWGLRRLEAPVDLLAEEDGYKYKFFTSLFGTKYTYHPTYGWSVGIKYTTRYRDLSGNTFVVQATATQEVAQEATQEVVGTSAEQKETVEPAEYTPTETPVLLPKPTAASLPAQAPPREGAEPSPPSPKELDQAVEPQQEPTSDPEHPQSLEEEPQTPPAEEHRSSSQSPEASSECSESDEAESRTDQVEEGQDQSAQGGSSSR